MCSGKGDTARFTIIKHPGPYVPSCAPIFKIILGVTGFEPATSMYNTLICFT